MNRPANQSGLRKQLGDAPDVANKCLAELKQIYDSSLERYARSYEFFDFGMDRGFERETTIEGKLNRLTRSCVWQSIALKTEFRFKLLYSIDGYLSAAQSKNPLSTFLLARHLLELVATLSEIDFMLRDAAAIPLDDWVRRGGAFLSVLTRARYSTSDDRHKPIFKILEVADEHTQPIRMKNALKRLSGRYGFAGAKKHYGTLSNLCHHNGSGHRLLTAEMRMGNSILTPQGGMFVLKEDVAVASMRYPAPHFAKDAVGLTARVAWWCAKSANTIIDDILETPFVNSELSNLTHGRLTKVSPVDFSSGPMSAKRWHGDAVKVGRNDSCPCGSGKKYKFCCISKRQFRTGRPIKQPLRK